MLYHTRYFKLLYSWPNSVEVFEDESSPLVDNHRPVQSLKHIKTFKKREHHPRLSSLSNEFDVIKKIFS
jgi:hypothetical protein